MGYAKPHELLRAETLASEFRERELSQHLCAEHLLHVARDVMAIANVDSIAVYMLLRQSRAYHLTSVHGDVETGYATKV